MSNFRLTKQKQTWISNEESNPGEKRAEIGDKQLS